MRPPDEHEPAREAASTAPVQSDPALLRCGSWCARNLVALVVLVVSVYAVIEANHWRFQVRLAPQSMAATAAVLATVALIRDTRAGRARQPATGSVAASARRFAQQQRGMLWFVAALVIVLLLGIQYGLLVAIAAISKLALSARWVTTVVLVLAAGSVLLLFDVFFRVFWFEGWLFRLLPG